MQTCNGKQIQTLINHLLVYFFNLQFLHDLFTKELNNCAPFKGVNDLPIMQTKLTWSQQALCGPGC